MPSTKELPAGSPAMEKLEMERGPSRLEVPVSSELVVRGLSSATERVSSASEKPSVTGVTLMERVELSQPPLPSITV